MRTIQLASSGAELRATEQDAWTTNAYQGPWHSWWLVHGVHERLPLSVQVRVTKTSWSATVEVVTACCNRFLELDAKQDISVCQKCKAPARRFEAFDWPTPWAEEDVSVWIDALELAPLERAVVEAEFVARLGAICGALAEQVYFTELYGNE